MTERATVAYVPCYKSIVSNFMVYQDQIETNLLQLFAHQETSQWFYIIFGVIFEVDIVTKKQTSIIGNDFSVFCKFVFPTLLLPSCPTVVLAALPVIPRRIV